MKWTITRRGPVIATDYEVLGLTSGDWPLFGIFFYIVVYSFICLKAMFCGAMRVTFS
ncbi:MAG: hypothetical protein HKN47_11545, partial [Pirellulaceae bacterium]|nr:hypothetical protein [Pirellulaceae bacterium]